MFLLGAQGAMSSTMTAADADGLYLDIQTRLGAMVCRLDTMRAPRTVACLAGLVDGTQPWIDPASGDVCKQPYFDALPVCQVVPGQSIEAGLRAGSGRSGPGFRLWEAPSAALLPAGPWLAIRNRGNGADGAKFLLILTNETVLLQDAMVVGSLVAGVEVVDAISRLPADEGQPREAILLDRVKLRRVGVEAETYDGRAYALPRPMAASLAVAREGGSVELAYSSRPFSASVLFESGDLRAWTSRDLGLSMAATSVGRLRETPAGSARFYKLAQVLYPPDGYAPVSLAGGRMTLTFVEGEVWVLEFDQENGGWFSSMVQGEGTFASYAYRQDIDTGWLDIPGGMILPALRLRFDFERGAVGEFRGQWGEGRGSAVRGTFAMSGLPRPLVMIEAGPVLPAWVGHGYQKLLEAAGGGTNRVWRVVSGQPPPGLHLANSGLLSGTPTNSGNYVFAVEVRDENGAAVTNRLNIPVLAVDPRLLQAYWALDGDWADAMGGRSAVPTGMGKFVGAPEIRGGANVCFGTGSSPTNNGAIVPDWTALAESAGVAMEGWVWLEDESSIGTLFGFGGGSWELPKFTVSISYGFIWLDMGREMDGASMQYARIGDTCWHHLAVVLPRGFRAGEPFRMYLDGVRVTALATNYSATGTACLDAGVSLFGEPFQVGRFAPMSGDGTDFRHMRLDEVRVWARELTEPEVAELARPTGVGDLCVNHPPPNWAPGPRFVAPSPEPVPALDLGIHGLTDDTICVITDPNPWLKARIVEDCGVFLRAMETNRNRLEAWVCDRHYAYAASEIIQHYRPGLLDALARNGHFMVSGPDLPPTALPAGSLWPQATREFRAPSLGASGGEIHTYNSENVYFTFLKLPAAMKPGGTYRITDAWGNTVSWTYDEDRTISWALKVNQVGYLPDAPHKFGYLGLWTGPGGALDLARFDGQPFQVCREGDAGVVSSGVIRFRRDDSVPVSHLGTPYLMSGEKVYELDFSSLRTPGRYYLRVPGAGRSWAFAVGQNAMGEAFYVHARGLFHQRCDVLSTNFTPWARGDAHRAVFKAGFPTQGDDYADHSAEGWGFLDADGHYAHAGWVADEFSAITATKSTELIPGLHGGWHDAGDYDQPNDWHLLAARDLVESYLMFPENFTDGQLNIPESGNGIPDLLDEALWGVEVCRLGQETNGAVALWINTDSSITGDDLGEGVVPYYLGIASRNSAVRYAEFAGLLARGLEKAGAVDRAQLYLDSAVRAWTYAISTFDQNPRVSISMVLHGKAVRWVEPVTLDAEAKLRTLIQLWLATGERAYYDALNTPAMSETFRIFVIFLYWRTKPFDLMDVALAPEKFPDGWGALARQGLLQDAEDWLRMMDADAYRKLWYAPGEGYFVLNGWGHANYDHVRNQIAAWRLTGDERFRNAALLSVDWMQGANPQGRVYTTGLGQNYVVHPLHLPSDSDGIADPVPGLTIYGPSLGVNWGARVWTYGLYETRDPGFDFSGSARAQLPPPWNDPNLTMEQVGNILSEVLPVWRTLVNLEGTNPAQVEFTVSDTISHAVAVTGCLMGPGWVPSAELKNRRPRSAEALRDALWFQP